MDKILGEKRKKVHLLVRDTLFAANLHKVLIIKTFEKKNHKTNAKISLVLSFRTLFYGLKRLIIKCLCAFCVSLTKRCTERNLFLRV